MSDMTSKCACGCGGEMEALDSRGRTRSYLHGHFQRGKKHSQEWLSRMSAGMKAAWADPNKLVTMRHHSPEFVEKRVAPLRGRVHPPEFGAKISAALTGKTLSPEHRSKAIKNLRHPKGKDNPLSGRVLTEEQEARRRQGISEARKGCHNFGRAARDRLDHFNAKHWIVRHPRGAIFEFDNLQSWCRKNEHLFLPDLAPKSKLALWQRAVGGFNNMQRNDRKASHHWRGWTLVSVLERKTQTAPDLICRNNETQVYLGDRKAV